MVGELGDGTPYSAGGRLGEDERWPLYAQPYARSSVEDPGLLAGTVNFGTSGGSVASVAADQEVTSGTLNWRKAPIAEVDYARYPLGFRERLEVIGSRYTPPPPGRVVMQINDWHIYLGQRSPGVPPFPELVDLNALNRFIITPRESGIQMQLNPTNGLFSGSMRFGEGHGIAASETLPFRGVLLQKQKMGGGVMPHQLQAIAVSLGE
jgi:hypothetical protein